MSLNQSRADKSESSRYRKSGRSGSFNQQRNSGGRGKGGGGPPAPPTSWSPSLSSNQSFKKSNNAQGGQSRTSFLDSNSDSNNASADLIAQNGAHFQPPLHADAPLIGANVKPTDVSTQKSTQPIPKVPSSNAATVMSDTTAPTTVANAPADASKSFPLQFGSISPGFMNGMQIPARTSSVPPNLDEQKRDQARHDLLRAGLTLSMPSIPIPKQQLPRKAPVVTRVSDTPASLSQMTPHVVSTQSVTPSEVTTISETSQAAIPHICRSSTPPAGASTRAATQTVSMLDNVRIVRDRLERFVFPANISMIGARGTKGIIDTTLEGLAQILAAAVCLFSRFVQFSQFNSTVRGERLAHEAVKMELLAAQGRIAELEVDGKASEAKLVAIRERVALREAACTRVEAKLVATRERVVNLEAELVATCKKATKLEIDGEAARLRAEAELKAARERVFRAEADLQLAHERAAKAEADSDSGLADAFIDGYEELREKISAAFPNIDLSSFVPYETSDDVDGDDGDFDSA